MPYDSFVGNGNSYKVTESRSVVLWGQSRDGRKGLPRDGKNFWGWWATSIILIVAIILQV
jgi:hypothetical protein